MKVLFVDKVLAGRCKAAPRGVELFNIRLLQELTAAGIDLTVILHPSWLDYLPDCPFTCLHSTGNSVPDEISATHMLRLVGREKFDVLLLGNVANRLIGFVVWARLLRICRNCLVIAHREPSMRVLLSKRVWPRTFVVAVNNQIESRFMRAGFRNTAVYYGIMDAEVFASYLRQSREGRVKFCVVGNLENAWKGADTAIAAFRAMPPDMQNQCELHLASYHKPRVFPEDNIIPYRWMAADEIHKFLSRMDVMVVPSRDEQVMRETFSQVMVQGMLSALPCIVTSLPILAEKLDCGGGLIAADIQEISAAMMSLAESQDLRVRLGREARQTAKARYIWSTSHFINEFLQPAAAH